MAIASCRNTQLRVEIIVVDDGSDDGTLEWLEQQQGLTISKQNHLGKCWAVNRGFDLAKGKYIRFLDSDDLIGQGSLDEQFELAERASSDIVVSGYRLIDQQEQVLADQLWTDCDDFVSQQLGECDGSHYSAFLFNRNFLKDIPHRPDYAFRDDRMLILEAALKQPVLAVHPGLALLHRVHEKSRLQRTAGLQQSTQNFQHLNIYKYILSQLERENRLNKRRIAAATSKLWPLACWIAKDFPEEAAEVVDWIFQLAPDFKILEKGVQGWLYRTFGFRFTQKLLRIRRRFMNMFR